jgi:serine/threonine-protein kinase HipA
MCVSNVDDHLRNHGFVLDPAGGWHLAPAYDMNPVPSADGLKLNVSTTDNSQDLSLARDVAPSFRIKPATATAIIDDVVAAVRTWRDEASAIGIPRAEQARIERAFRVAESGRARPRSR